MERLHFVTGGNSGMGLAAAKELAQEGAYVFITGRRELELTEAVKQIGEEFFDQIFDINVKGLVFTVQKALPLMPNGASIILKASVVASKGLSSNSVYS